MGSLCPSLSSRPRSPFPPLGFTGAFLSRAFYAHARPPAPTPTPLPVVYRCTDRAEARRPESASLLVAALMQMTLTAKEGGYPPINRAPPCTPSVCALRCASRREIFPLARARSTVISGEYGATCVPARRRRPSCSNYIHFVEPWDQTIALVDGKIAGLICGTLPAG